MPTSAEKEAFEPLVYCIKTMTRFRGWQPDEDRAIRAIFPLMQNAMVNTDCSVIVEVGSWAGQNAIDMADNLKTVPGRLPIIQCIDTWQGSYGDTTGVVAEVLNREDPDGVLSVFMNNIGDRWDKQIAAFKMDSLEAAIKCDDEHAAAVFIDANHSYEAVRDDIEAWWPKVKAGGLLCGHDYHSFDGVKTAVEHHFGKRWFLKDAGCGVVGNCWYVWKTSNNNGPISSASS